MKKILSIALIFLAIFTMFSMFTSRVKPQENGILQILWEIPVTDNMGYVFTDTGDVDGDGIVDVAIVPYDSSPQLQPATYNTLQVIKSDGTPLWSKYIQIDWAKVAIGDVDNDGKGEVFVFGTISDGNYGAAIYAFDDNGDGFWTSDKRPLRLMDDYWGDVNYLAFINLDDDVELEMFAASRAYGKYTNYAIDTDGTILWKFSLGNFGSSFVFSDVTGDDDEEIILASMFEMHVFDRLGQPVIPPITKVSTTFDHYVASCDLTGDGINDYVLAIGDYEQSRFWNTLYAIRNDGTDLWDHSYPLNLANRPHFPVVVDVDDDGLKDVVCFIGESVRAYKGSDGSELWSFGNLTYFGASYAYPIVHFDIDHDSEEEIIVSVGSRLFALSLDGNLDLELTLPNNGSWAWTAHVEGPEIPVHEAGDVNDDGFDELIISEIIDGRHYVAAVMLTVVKISAALDVDPDTLNLKSNGEWITAYIELPEEYSVSKIDVFSIVLNGTLSVDPAAPTEIGDYDVDGIPDLMVKFDRAAVIDWLGTVDYGEDTGKSVEVTFVIAGDVAGTPFEGVDTVRVLLKG